MVSIKGTIYEKYPLLAFTPLGFFDIITGTMLQMCVDSTFLQFRSLTPMIMNKSMGDFVPKQSKE